jgi:tetratricopeptide (TPR) repeat protein
MSMQLRSACLLLLFSTFLPATVNGEQKNAPNSESMRDLRHQDPQWLLVQPHLPDPATATPQMLELAGDVLRARRFPEDALEYYNHALRKGGPEATLMNKLGVTELELHNTAAARIYFERLVRLMRKDAQGWNNLGAVECIEGYIGRAIADYNRAIKLDKVRDKTSAAYHSNLGAALIEKKDFKGARRQYEIALRMDPEMTERGGATGMTARMLSPEDHARYCYEMARLYAERKDDGNMLHYLTMASEAGFDVLTEMSSDKVLGNYRKDPRVLLLVRNSQALRSGRAVAQVKGGELPPLAPTAH